MRREVENLVALLAGSEVDLLNSAQNCLGGPDQIIWDVDHMNEYVHGKGYLRHWTMSQESQSDFEAEIKEYHNNALKRGEGRIRLSWYSLKQQGSPAPEGNWGEVGFSSHFLIPWIDDLCCAYKSAVDVFRDKIRKAHQVVTSQLDKLSQGLSIPMWDHYQNLHGRSHEVNVNNDHCSYPGWGVMSSEIRRPLRLNWETFAYIQSMINSVNLHGSSFGVRGTQLNVNQKFVEAYQGLGVPLIALLLTCSDSKTASSRRFGK